MHQILTLDASGQPHRWSTWEDAITLKVKGLINWELGNETVFHGGISRMTGNQSHIEVGTIISLKGKYKPTRLVPPLNNRNLFRRDLHICAYCGRFTPDTKMTRDHIIPVSKGGRDIWTNVVASCWKCNNHKNDRTPEEAGMELLYIPYTPSRAEELILENRKILADQMEFLLGFVPEHSRVHELSKRVELL